MCFPQRVSCPIHPLGDTKPRKKVAMTTHSLMSLKARLAAIADWPAARDELRRLHAAGEVDDLTYSSLQLWLTLLAYQRAEDYAAR
jgi:hypothetical protein